MADSTKNWYLNPGREKVKRRYTAFPTDCLMSCSFVETGHHHTEESMWTRGMLVHICDCGRPVGLPNGKNLSSNIQMNQTINNSVN